MKRSITSALIACCTLGLVTGTAAASDGAVCYSTTFTLNSSATPGTTTYPQLANTTTFNCGGTARLTIKQLSQAGWIISSVQELVYSTTFNTNGTSTTKTRVMLVIQK